MKEEENKINNDTINTVVKSLTFLSNESKSKRTEMDQIRSAIKKGKIEVFKDICNPEGELRKTYNLTDDKLSGIRWEDKYFCNDLYNIYKLNVPKFNQAVWFALDMSVDVIYGYFGWKGKPMGCHSWDKNIRYWKKVIPELIDNNEVIDYCEKKHEEFFKLYYDENDSSLRK